MELSNTFDMFAAISRTAVPTARASAKMDRTVGKRVADRCVRASARAVEARIVGGGLRMREERRAQTPSLGNERRGDLAVVNASSGDSDAMTKSDDEDDGSSDVSIVAACVAVSCLFGAGIGVVEGADKASEYFAGYLLEQSLSVDNLFVFILLFEYFQVPPVRQTRVLNYGIYGALLMRAIMVVAGVELIENFQPILLVFAGILIFSSYKLLSEAGEEEEDMSENAIVKFCSSFMDVSDEFDGDNFFTVQNGVKMATPLLLVLAVVEISDVVFAVDSIPAVFGVTQDPFIVYTSNLFAILSLRQLYTLISKAVGELKYLQTAVALVLGFIGVKMIAEYAGAEIPTEASLAVVVTMLGGGVGASLLLPDADKKEGE